MYRLNGICKNCGEYFERETKDKNKTTIFCSSECYNKHRRTELISGHCEYCGEYFEKKYAARFCSHTCSNSFKGDDPRKYTLKENIYLIKQGLWKCSKCMEVLPADIKHYHKSKASNSGICSTCKSCRKKYDRETGIINGSHAEIKRLYELGFKKCGVCKEVLSVDLFYKHKNSKYGLSHWCRKCTAEYRKQPDVVKRKRKYGQERRRKINSNPEMKEKYLKWRRKYENTRHATDIEYKLKKNMCSLMHNSIKGIDKKGIRWQTLTGYTVEELKKNLQGKMIKGMSWSNYGTKWHVDHKIPTSKWRITSVHSLAFKECWALKNLQPLWKEENMRKSNKISRPFQLALPIKVRC